MSNGTIIVPPPSPPNTGQLVNCPPQSNLYPPPNPTQLWGGYPPKNPTSAWSTFAPPPTGCVYGMDGMTQSWVPVPTRWEVQCIVQQYTQGSVPEAPADGADYVRNGLDAEWINVQTLVFDGGTY